MASNLRNVDLNLLTVFETIYSEGKLSLAAERLNMTQPAVSNALARLRLTFKDDLFIRGRTGMTPTPKASTLIVPVREALFIIRDVVDTHEDFDFRRSQRVFKIAMNDMAEVTLLPNLLRAFEECQATVSIASYSDMSDASLALLKQGQLDFYLGSLRPDIAHLSELKIGEDDLVVVCRQDHPRIGDSINKTQFLAEQHIIINHRENHKTILEQLLDDQRLSRKVLAEVRQAASIPAMVARTDGISVLPKRIAAYYARTLSIKILPFPIKEKKISAYLFWNKALDQDPGHQWFKQMIVDVTS